MLTALIIQILSLHINRYLSPQMRKPKLVICPPQQFETLKILLYEHL